VDSTWVVVYGALHNTVGAPDQAQCLQAEVLFDYSDKQRGNNEWMTNQRQLIAYKEL
jgi:hypothetical protein